MNWEAIGALAEVIGSVAILVSLFYVAAEAGAGRGFVSPFLETLPYHVLR